MSLSVNGRAIAAMSVANLVFLSSDTFIKTLSARLPPGEIMALRGALVSVPFFIVLCAASRLRGQWRTLLLPGVLGRAACEGLLSIVYVLGLARLPIANASAIYQTLPLVLAGASAVFFGERAGWKRWAAIVAGFCGTLMIVKPGASGFNPASLFIVASVGIAAVRDLLTRSMPAHLPSLLISTSTSAGVMLAGFLAGTAEQWQPVGTVELAQLAATGVLVSGGWLLLVTAVKTGDLTVVAPFRYTTLIWALLSGMLVFGDVPDLLSLAGMAVIALSGLYILHEQGRRTA